MALSQDTAQRLIRIIESMPAQRSSADASFFGYVLSVALIAVALGSRELIGPPELGMPYLTFFPAVALAAVFGGIGPCLLATAVAAVSATYLYIPPYHALPWHFTSGTVWSNAVFLFGGAIVCVAIQAMHSYFKNFRHANERLDENRKLLHALIEGMTDAIFVKDAAGRYRLFNQAAARIAGKNPDDIIGKDDTFLFAAAGARAVMADDRSIMALGKTSTYEERIAPAGGDELVVLTTKGPLVDESGAVTGVFGISRDITQSKKAEAAILEKLAMQDQLAKIAATVPGVIYSFRLRADGTRSFPYTSAATEDFSGFKPEELKDDCAVLFALIHADDVGYVNETIEQSAHAMKPWRAEFRFRHPHKGLRWIEGHSMPQREADGSILWHGFLTDITERKQIETELIAAKQAADTANAAKSRFLAAASHDLRQPMQAINLFLNVLNRTTLSDEQKPIGQNLVTTTKALGELLDALLDISKLDAGIVKPQLVPTDIQEVFQRIESEFAALALERNLRFKLCFPQRALGLQADPKLLMGMLRNVVGNALRYTERGGILVGTRLRAACLAIQVWDTGIGIPAQHLAQIYDEFFQIDNPQRDRTRGLGLGLSIVKRLATLMDYEVDCRTRPGRGTVFEIRIPLDRALVADRLSSATHAADAIAVLPYLQGRRVVLVEDDYLVAKALEVWFAVYGMRVSSFSAGADALAHPAIMDADYYVSDFRLPGGMNGIELLDAIQIRAARPINALLITGDTAAEQIDAFAANRWQTLFKPVESSMLLLALAAMMPRETKDAAADTLATG